ncbi:hypothetical protein [Piscinibacter sp.]|uniref:hypothetical protein n=1 Tax=Piscinibacter sp. TaxID=1903157 RepID=UPI002BE2D38C|nr:hypothetical protein [Albitalea sp.]HUG25098.1 hypothetical protein [Albitalea sp.]
MHLLIPFASALSDASMHTFRDLSLPNLSSLLTTMTPVQRIGTDEYSLTPPHERALADAFGWRGDDGTLPWAARQAQADGVETGDRPWGLLTPVHWHVGRDHITLADPSALNFSDEASRQFIDAIRHLFESEGWTIAYGAPTRWYAAHDTLAGLPCASLDRVIGRNVDLWLANHPQARLIRRLQNEVQMLLYTHPLNDEREARGELPVNSFWLSGCGAAQPVANAAGMQVDDTLRAPLLAEDWAGWADAWRALDAGPLAAWLGRSRRGEATSLTLCGERHAQRFDHVPRSAWQRLAGLGRRTPVHAILESL